VGNVGRHPGVYVPALYDVSYAADGTLAAVTPNHPAAPAEVMKRVVTVLPPPVTKFIVPLHQRGAQPRRHRDHARLHARLPLSARPA
jgi:hypothetical protein